MPWFIPKEASKMDEMSIIEYTYIPKSMRLPQLSAGSLTCGNPCKNFPEFFFHSSAETELFIVVNFVEIVCHIKTKTNKICYTKNTSKESPSIVDSILTAHLQRSADFFYYTLIT